MPYPESILFHLLWGIEKLHLQQHRYIDFTRALCIIRSNSLNSPPPSSRRIRYMEKEGYQKETTSQDVVDLYSALENLGIKVWLDGGWAIDALLGTQTRVHEDLDIAVERKNLDRVKKYIESQGFEEEKGRKEMWDLVLVDGKEREIEVHAFSFDENGQIVEEKAWDGFTVNSLGGIGSINGHKVNCVSVEQLIKTHRDNGRALRPKDYQDIPALCDKFGIEYPEEYAHLKK